VACAGCWGASPRPASWPAAAHAAQAGHVRAARVHQRGVAVVARSPGPPCGARPLGRCVGRAPAHPRAHDVDVRPKVHRSGRERRGAPTSRRHGQSARSRRNVLE
jgi:hypothetical protein